MQEKYRKLMADNYTEQQYGRNQEEKVPLGKGQNDKNEKKESTGIHRHPGSFLQNQTKKVVAVHDLSGVGRVSLMAVIPILSSMGFQVCPLPTAVLSTHTQYPTYSFLDLTDEMRHIIENWEKMEVRFDTFYTGYLGSPQQAQIVEEFILKFRRENDMVVVDPVLGDNGHLYKGITEEMVTEMKKLIRLADVITPNLTELFYLLDRPFQERRTEESIESTFRSRSQHCHRYQRTGQRRPTIYVRLCLQSPWQPLLESDLPLSASTLSRYRRYVYQCHYGFADAGRQPAYRTRPCHTVHPARHPCDFRLRI